MTKLEQTILNAQRDYYNGTPSMSDAQFDELWEKLKVEQPDSELLKNVGADHTDGFKKVKHDIMAGSQEKANTEADMSKWLSSIDKKLVIADYKMDGASIILSYDKGNLIRVASRGDGYEGDDVTSNALKMNHLPKTIDSNFTGTVRGECCLSRTNKAEHFADKANCRNAGTGIMKRLDGKGCEYLDIVVYDAQSLDGSNFFETQVNLKKWLETNGFKLAPWKLFKNLSPKDCMAYLDEVFKEFDNLEYDIDGLVWKQNAIDMEDFKEVRPKTNIALKPARIYAQTKVTNIEWSVSNGTYTPVVIYEPTPLNGTVNTRASISNVASLEDLQIEIGDTIEIVKCGLIIPKVVRNISKDTFLAGYYS